MEVVARNVPSGLGSPVFDKLEAELAKACMSLPASKGFEVRHVLFLSSFLHYVVIDRIWVPRHLIERIRPQRRVLHR